jgi:LysM repeat protein
MLTLALLFVVLVASVVLVMAQRKAETLPRTEAPGVITYTVATGDTLWAIAATYSNGQDIRHVIDAIKQTNHLQTATVQPGQALLIPVPKH